MKFSCCLLIFLVCFNMTYSQGFLRTQDNQIINDNGEILLRGIGFGGWMLQEGYMLQTESFANAQYQIREKIEDLIGKENTEHFYKAWLDNYCSKSDVDSIAAWGFNSIRLPLHYNLFTYAIQDEPVKGQNTWLESGFELVDHLLDWCEQNNIYLILDLHAAPGGQGKEASISDYDPSKPSLWQSEENRAKTVALWRKIAERYANDTWIGGYDLINETNWDMSNNTLLKNLYVEITQSIRQVDQNHIIFIEGNWFANDFTGLTPPWDNNMVYSFHKYWSFNNQQSIQWMVNIRNRYHVPIWCGEAGENSNVWFTDAIRLFEKNNIGWAWWPLKKIESISGPLSVFKSDGYDRLLDYWKGTSSRPTPDFAVKVLMDLTENLKIQKNRVNKDVLDAMFRQVKTDEPEPFKTHEIPGVIFASDYDLGRNEISYFDTQVADYHVSTDTWTGWNNGWNYRNDGVDIELCNDNDLSNGYNVGWIEDGEWLTYTVNINRTAGYQAKFRVSSLYASGKLYLELDDRVISNKVNISNSGAWQNWQNKIQENIILEKGTHILKIFFDSGQFNLNYLEFDNPIAAEDVNFESLLAKIVSNGNQISLTLNKKIQGSLPEIPADFYIKTKDKDINISSYTVENSGYQILFSLAEQVYFEDVVRMFYQGDEIIAEDGTALQKFDNLLVENLLPARFSIPGKIEAEDFDLNSGFVLENTTDSGGGQNLGYSDVGDYADYLVTINAPGTYDVQYRVASLSDGGAIDLLLLDESGSQQIHTAYFPVTGGWQSWKTTTIRTVFPSGRYTFRIKVRQAGFNLNWMNINFVTLVENGQNPHFEYKLDQNYPNPFNSNTTIFYSLSKKNHVNIAIYDILGRKIIDLVDGEKNAGIHSERFNSLNLSSGYYFYKMVTDEYSETKRMLLVK